MSHSKAKDVVHTTNQPPSMPAKQPRRHGIRDYLSEGLRVIRELWEREDHYRNVKPIDTLFFLTYRCTSRCKTCTLWQRTDAAGEMNLDDWKRAVDQSAALGARNFELFGGDALLRKDVLVPLVAHIKTHPGLVADLVTNCNLMTEEMAHELVDAGLDNLWVSVDAVGADHDKVRGLDNTFDKVDNTITWFREARGGGACPRLHCNTTISNLNYNSFHRVVQYAENLGMDFVHLEYAGEFWGELNDESEIDGIKPNPFFIRQDGRSILASEEQARHIKDKIEQLKQDVRHMRVSMQCENIDKLTVGQMASGFCDNRRCFITRTKITIDPRGNVVGCPTYGSWTLGNIREQELSDIWNNDRHQAFMRHFEEGPMAVCDHCIMGVQRNYTLWQGIRDNLNRAIGRARR